MSKWCDECFRLPYRSCDKTCSAFGKEPGEQPTTYFTEEAAKEMKFYRYSFTNWGDRTVGLIMTNSIEEAYKIFDKVYGEYCEPERVHIKEVQFRDNVCEVYYGG